jgi:hypothetical protein
MAWSWMMIEKDFEWGIDPQIYGKSVRVIPLWESDRNTAEDIGRSSSISRASTAATAMDQVKISRVKSRKEMSTDGVGFAGS